MEPLLYATETRWLVNRYKLTELLEPTLNWMRIAENVPLRAVTEKPSVQNLNYYYLMLHLIPMMSRGSAVDRKVCKLKWSRYLIL